MHFGFPNPISDVMRLFPFICITLSHFYMLLYMIHPLDKVILKNMILLLKSIDKFPNIKFWFTHDRICFISEWSEISPAIKLLLTNDIRNYLKMIYTKLRITTICYALTLWMCMHKILFYDQISILSYNQLKYHIANPTIII